MKIFETWKQRKERKEKVDFDFVWKHVLLGRLNEGKRVFEDFTFSENYIFGENSRVDWKILRIAESYQADLNYLRTNFSKSEAHEDFVFNMLLEESEKSEEEVSKFIKKYYDNYYPT